MKKTGIVVGLFTAIAFCAGAIAATEPESGRFSFQARTPEPKDHFITLRFQFEGRMPNDSTGGNMVTGVNVYWKTKDKNQLQGRKFYSSLNPNLPRPGQNFSDMHEIDGWAKYEGNHEHIEWLVWDYVDMDYDFNNGCPPTAGNTHTRFYYYRFKDYIVREHDGFNYCSTQSTIAQPKQEDVDVALSAFAVSYNTGICNRMGEYCIGAKDGGSQTFTKDVFIPSYKLEFLVIEVYSFQYDTGGGHQRKQVFYTLPVEALKFTPKNEPSKPNMMTLLRGDRDAGGEFSSFGVSDYVAGGVGDEKGYYDAEDSRFFLNEEKSKWCNQLSANANGCEYDFSKLDTLVLSIYYNSSSKIPKWDAPFSTGVVLSLAPTFMDPECGQDASQCDFLSR
jgi:hypothetical protein